MSNAGSTCEYIRQCVMVEAILADNERQQPFGISMEFLEDFVYLRQFLNETTFEYLERFKFYLDKFPNYGLPFYELLNHFLYGMVSEERYELDVMAGGSIMDCTLRHEWSLIQERAEITKPYVEENSLQELALLVEEIQNSQQNSELAADEFCKTMDKIDTELALIKARQELTCALSECSCEQSLSLDDKVLAATEESKEEEERKAKNKEISDPEFTYADPEESLEKSIESPCLAEIRTELLVSNSLSSSSLQVSIYKNNLTLDNLLELFCKDPGDLTTEHDVGKTRIHHCLIDLGVDSNIISSYVHPTSLPNELILQVGDLFVPLDSYVLQMRKCFMLIILDCKILKSHVDRPHMRKPVGRDTFGWKPGWRDTRAPLGESYVQAEEVAVRKFDGVHPWAPNIL